MFSNVIVRLVAYYIAVLACTGGVYQAFPQISTYVELERSRTAKGDSLNLDRESTPVTADRVEGIARVFDAETSVPVIVALTLAFALALPVTWVYHWTRPKKRYAQAFAHTLLVVPIAIALVVFLVKGSLALAFGLTGIVAAVRFRTTLNDTMDAVFTFIVIGIGLAAGAQLLNVALLGSVIFNIVALAVWKTNYGAEAANMSGWSMVPQQDVSVPPGNIVAPKAVTAIATQQPAQPCNARLRVHTNQVGAALKAVSAILESNAKYWEKTREVEDDYGSTMIEFNLRLKKSADLSGLIREIEEAEGGEISKVELKMRKPAKE